MAFVNLFKKNTADPKDIDLLKVGAKIKTAFPPSAVSFFKKKVTAVQKKPFEFLVERDESAGKLRIVIKKLQGQTSDQIFAWDDKEFLGNQNKLGEISRDLSKWAINLGKAATAMKAQRQRFETFLTVIDGLERRIESKAVRPGADAKLASEAPRAIQQVIEPSKKIYAAARAVWTAGGESTIPELLKRADLDPKDFGGDDLKDLEKDYDKFHPSIESNWKDVSEAFEQMQKAGATLGPRMGAIFKALQQSPAAGRGPAAAANPKLAALAKTLGTHIATLRTRRKTDFEKLRYNETLAAAKDFLQRGQSFAALSRNPAAIPPIMQRNMAMNAAAVRLAGQVDKMTKQWAKLPAPVARDPRIRQGLELLRVQRNGYLAQLANYQKALKAFTGALNAVRLRAAGAAAKTA